MEKLRKLYTYFWITNKFTTGEPQFFIFYLGSAVVVEVTHGLFTFNAAPFNSMYVLSLLAVHELHGRSFWKSRECRQWNGMEPCLRVQWKEIFGLILIISIIPTLILIYIDIDFCLKFRTLETYMRTIGVLLTRHKFFFSTERIALESWNLHP